jgi:hypothetical protein
MPVFFRQSGFRFHFYSYEGGARQPVHVDVARAGSAAKIWLRPELCVAQNYGLTSAELRLALEIATMRREEIENAWNSFFA